MRDQGLLDAFQLKLLMAFLMLLDHLYYDLFPEALGWAHIAARVVAPVFAYLVAEGMAHTSSRSRYIGRMLGFGCVTLAGNILLGLSFGTLTFTGSARENVMAAAETLTSFTVLISLGITACVIHAKERAVTGPNRVLWLMAGGGALCLSLFFEGGLMIPVMGLIFYFLRGRRVVMCAVYALVVCAYFLPMITQYGFLPAQFWMILAVLPILCYNGRRGSKSLFAKYFFYVFYPAHVWIIFVVWQSVGGR